jgi:hypothetical protein
VFIGLYVGYVLYLYLQASEPGTLGGPAADVLLAAFPVLAVLFGLMAVREYRSESRA